MIVRDPIHGDMTFGEAERRVMDTWQMQRLRGVRQTGTAYLVYPGCVHTRFEHSLGTANSARRIMDVLRQKGFRITDEQAAVVVLAALVHDVSHLPFGHTFEDERRIFPRHDIPERLDLFLSRGRLGSALDASGLRGPVISLLTEKRYDPPWMKQIVSSTVDADLLDYLRRDAYFAGLRQDYDDRILSTFMLADDNLAVDIGRLSTRTELLHLLRLRYFLTERIYFHHAKVASGAMVAKAVELAVGAGLSEPDLYDLTDDALLSHLLSLEDAAITRLVDGFRNRQLLKRAYALSATDVGRKGRDELIANYNRSAEARLTVEREIADAVALDPTQIILYCPDTSAIKEAGVFVVNKGELRRLNEPLGSPPFDVKVVEDQYEALWRLYVFAPEGLQGRVGAICERVLGEPNGLKT